MKASSAPLIDRIGPQPGIWKTGLPRRFFLTVLLLGGCATLVETRVEETIVKELPRIVGPAVRYDVEVEGTTVKDEMAYLKKVRVVGERVDRPKSPILDRIKATMTDVAVDRKKKKLISIGTIDAEVRVLATDIAAFLEGRKSLKNVSVTLNPPYEITLTAQPSIADFALPKAVRVKIRGKLVASEGDLIVEIVDLRIAGFPIGAISAAVLEELINPLVDLSTLPAPTNVTSVAMTADAVLLTASGSRPLSRAASQ